MEFQLGPVIPSGGIAYDPTAEGEIIESLPPHVFDDDDLGDRGARVCLDPASFRVVSICHGRLP